MDCCWQKEARHLTNQGGNLGATVYIISLSLSLSPLAASAPHLVAPEGARSPHAPSLLNQCMCVGISTKLMVTKKNLSLFQNRGGAIIFKKLSFSLSLTKRAGGGGGSGRWRVGSDISPKFPPPQSAQTPLKGRACGPIILAPSVASRTGVMNGTWARAPRHKTWPCYL